jgi:hypothetical protein
MRLDPGQRFISEDTLGERTRLEGLAAAGVASIGLLVMLRGLVGV